MKALTDRQLQILREVRRCRSDEEIGELLGISKHTVKNTMRVICRNMDAKNRFQAVRHAESCGQLEKEGELPVEKNHGFE